MAHGQSRRLHSPPLGLLRHASRALPDDRHGLHPAPGNETAVPTDAASKFFVQRPGSLCSGMSTWSVLVPTQARVDVAPNDVDDASADSMHAAREYTALAIDWFPVLSGNSSKRGGDQRAACELCDLGVRMMWGKLPPRGPALVGSSREVRVRIRCGRSAYAPSTVQGLRRDSLYLPESSLRVPLDLLTWTKPGAAERRPWLGRTPWNRAGDPCCAQVRADSLPASGSTAIMRLISRNRGTPGARWATMSGAWACLHTERRAAQATGDGGRVPCVHCLRS
jgi:hypothetical protein